MKKSILFVALVSLIVLPFTMNSRAVAVNSVWFIHEQIQEFDPPYYPNYTNIPLAYDGPCNLNTSAFSPQFMTGTYTAQGTVFLAGQCLNSPPFTPLPDEDASIIRLETFMRHSSLPYKTVSVFWYSKRLGMISEIKQVGVGALTNTTLVWESTDPLLSQLRGEDFNADFIVDPIEFVVIKPGNGTHRIYDLEHRLTFMN